MVTVMLMVFGGGCSGVGSTDSSDRFGSTVSSNINHQCYCLHNSGSRKSNTAACDISWSSRASSSSWGASQSRARRSKRLALGFFSQQTCASERFTKKW